MFYPSIHCLSPLMRQKRGKGNYHGNYVPFHSWKLFMILHLASFRLSLTLSSHPGKYLWTLFPRDWLQGPSYGVPRTWKSGTWLDTRKEITFIRPPFIIIVYWPQLLWSISIAVARHCYRDWGDKSRYNRQASQPPFAFFHPLSFFPILLQVLPGIPPEKLIAFESCLRVGFWRNPNHNTQNPCP